MGRLMARLLLRRLAGGATAGPTSIVIPTRLVVRATA